MRGDTKVDVSGIVALSRESAKRNITLKGVKAGVKILKLAARSAAPKRPGSGALQQAQGSKAAKGRKGTTISYAVQGARKKLQRTVRVPGRKKPLRVVPAFYDHLVQLGTRAHSLRAGAKLAGAGKQATAESGQETGKKHPGAKANPYRERAWLRVKSEAGEATLGAMVDALKAEIVKQAARVKAKGK